MTVTDTGGAAEPQGLPSRMIGVLISPAETFRRLIARPRWLDVLLVVTLIPAALWFWFLTTESGQVAFLDQQVRQMESFGQTVTDEAYAGIERSLPYMPYVVGGSTLVFGPIMTLIVAAILFAVFNAGLGGNASFKQVFSFVAHSGVVTMLQVIFTIPLNYVRESMSSPTNLFVFFPMLEEGSAIARFLGIIDLFIIWWIAVLAVGLAVLYRRRTMPIFVGLMATYVGFALIVALVMSAMSS
ncbi:MAG TPA: YIP1 family protein [Vicinamibacterales bacterium]|nr:YIP1 family protein [Vicinamibacterales bacterium]